MVTLRAREAMGTGQEILGISSCDESLWSWPRSNPALTTLLPLLAGGHFSLLAPLGEIQFARRAHKAALTGGWGGTRPSPLCSTQWDAYGLASPSCHPTCTGCRWRAHVSVCQDPASVRRGYAGWPRGRRHQSGVAVSATAQEWWV